MDTGDINQTFSSLSRAIIHLTCNMQRLFLTILLTTCFLSCAFASALPPIVRRKPGLITTPLKRYHSPRADIHPRLLTQQHINHAVKRLARMTGREAPSEHQLRSELHKRSVLLESARSTPPVSGTKHRFVSSFVKGHHSINRTLLARDKSSNHTGVSPLDISADLNGTITPPAKPPTGNHSLGLAIYANDVTYLANIQLGTPFQNFTFVMDSGSADFWVRSEHCNNSRYYSCGSGPGLGPRGSSSFVALESYWIIVYGDGTAVAGYVCMDRIGIADMTLYNYSLGAVTAETGHFGKVPWDGIMGFAQDVLSEEHVPTPIQALYSAKLISNPIVSFRISRLADELDDGEVTFGGLDENQYNASTLTTIPNVSDLGYWEGDINAIMVNGTNTGLAGRRAILDTGTTLLLVPLQDVQQIMKDLGGACDFQQCTIPCTTNASLAFAFGSSNTTFTVDPSDLAVFPVDTNDPMGDCTAGIQPGPSDTKNAWLLGDVFLKNVYLSLDLGKNEISLAKPVSHSNGTTA